MNISRDLALEIFELKEGFLKEDLAQAYRRLAKISHPDAGGNNILFLFIKECKEVLESPPQSSNKDSQEENNTNRNTNNYSHEGEKSRESYDNKKKVSDISLDLLYDEYYDLDDLMKDYSLRNIYLYAKVYIQPYFKRSLQQNFNITLITPFEDFLNFNRSLANFTETIYLPKEFKKFKLFNVKIILPDRKNFSFYVFNNSFKQLKVDRWRFKAIFNLSFKNSDD